MNLGDRLFVAACKKKRKKLEKHIKSGSQLCGYSGS